MRKGRTVSTLLLKVMRDFGLTIDIGSASTVDRVRCLGRRRDREHSGTRDFLVLHGVPQHSIRIVEDSLRNCASLIEQGQVRRLPGSPLIRDGLGGKSDSSSLLITADWERCDVDWADNRSSRQSLGRRYALRIDRCTVRDRCHAGQHSLFDRIGRSWDVHPKPGPDHSVSANVSAQ